MLDVLLQPEALLGLLMLTLIEIVLGIDNIIFISIMAGKLPVHQQETARRLGLLMALAFRVLLLLAIGYIIAMQAPLFYMGTMPISGRDLLLFLGGLFLLVKAGIELSHKVRPPRPASDATTLTGRVTFMGIVIQIIVIDIVFSFDSILTAVGLVENVTIMILAVVISMVVMLATARQVSDFVNRNPSIKILALLFLVFLGVYLMLAAIDITFSKGYLYAATAFALINELVNMAYRRNQRTTAQ